MDIKIIAQRAITARKKAGMTQDDVAKKLHMSESNISRFEDGQRKKVDLSFLTKYAKAVDVELSDLISSQSETKVPPRRNDEVPVVVQIPIYSQCASAGPGSPIQEYAYKSSAQLAGKNIIGIKVSGECLHPHLQDGDIIFYDADASPRDKDMVVVIINDALNVKRFRQRGQECWLESNGDTIEINGAQIQGVVLSFERKVR